MPFILTRNDITKVHADAIVNAANTSLLGGGGVDGAIHKAAGEKLLEECRKLGGCPVGEARVTHGYKMPCKYVIHTVGPIWRNGSKEEEELLYACYKNSLNLAEIKQCKSVAFPLISSGAYGCPKDKALSVACQAISDYLKTHDMEVILVLFDKNSISVSKELKLDIQNYISERYSEELSPGEQEKQSSFFNAPPSGQIVISGENRRHFAAGISLSALEQRLEKTDISFSQKLLEMIAERGLTASEVYHKANISKQVFSKIRKANYHPKKNTVLALAVALKLTVTETDELLSYAGYTLARNDKTDIIVSYFLEKCVYDIIEINIMLFDYELPLLGTV